MASEEVGGHMGKLRGIIIWLGSMAARMDGFVERADL
jgi:hypothetical protein